MFETIMNLLGFEKQLGVDTKQVTWRWRWKREKVVPVQKVQNEKPIEYLLNDMTTPDLVKTMAPPVPPAVPKFAVKDYQGGGFPRGSVQANAANIFVTIAEDLKFHQKFAGRDGIKPLNKWARTGVLAVIPRAGVDLNAFYNGPTLQLFYYNDPSVGRVVCTADSTDIVAHELGHAILDAHRPDTWSAASLEVWSFHEAFGDLNALFYVMTHDEMLVRSLEECGNDITKPSTMTRLAEDVGRAIYTLVGPDSGREPNALRNAINDFKYTDPSKLPEEAPNDKLAAECHSFGRVFVGAYYDFLVAVYQDTLSLGQTPLASLQHARDVAAQYLMRAIQNAPLNVKFYDSMGRTLLWVAKNSDGGRYYEQMRKAMMERQIIGLNVKSLSVAPTPAEGETMVKMQSTATIKLSDHFAIRAMSDNPLYEVEVEVPMEEAYLYDNDGNVIDSVSVSEDESFSAAQDFINYLHTTKSVDDTVATPFEVKNGKLVRTHFDCWRCRCRK